MAPHGQSLFQRALPTVLPDLKFWWVRPEQPDPRGVNETLLERFGYNDIDEVYAQSATYERWVQPSQEELARTVEYDMSDVDKEWLDSVNAERRRDGIDTVPYDVFEIIIDKLEKEWFDLQRHIPKPPASMLVEDSKCAICDDGECEASNAIVFCDGCNLAVHQDCYGVPYIPEGQWLCRKCTVSPDRPISCLLCPGYHGAFKQTINGQWAHLLCAIWINETCVNNTVYMEPIDGIDAIPKQRWKLVCNLCRKKTGACIQCSKASCYTAYHVTCARERGLHMKLGTNSGATTADGSPGPNVSYCDRHSGVSSRSGLAEEDREMSEELPTPNSAGFNSKKNPKKKKLQSHGDRFGASTGTGTPRSGSFFDGDESYISQEASVVFEPPPPPIKTGPTIEMPIVPRYIYNKLWEYIGKLRFMKKQAFVRMVCRYWSLKRYDRRGAPLLKRLHLEPWTAAGSSLEATDLQKEKTLEMVLQLRNDLEKVRNIVEHVRRRETEKLRRAEVFKQVIDAVVFPQTGLFRKTLRRIQELDAKQLFLKPVSRLDVPDYHIHVPFPMDWQTMHEKLDQNAYVTAADFQSDVNLLIANALRYNTADSTHGRAAVKLLNAVGPILAGLDAFDDPTSQVHRKHRLYLELLNADVIRDMMKVSYPEAQQDFDLVVNGVDAASESSAMAEEISRKRRRSASAIQARPSTSIPHDVQSFIALAGDLNVLRTEPVLRPVQQAVVTAPMRNMSVRETKTQQKLKRKERDRIYREKRKAEALRKRLEAQGRAGLLLPATDNAPVASTSASVSNAAGVPVASNIAPQQYFSAEFQQGQGTLPPLPPLPPLPEQVGEESIRQEEEDSMLDTTNPSMDLDVSEAEVLALLRQGHVPVEPTSTAPYQDQPSHASQLQELGDNATRPVPALASPSKETNLPLPQPQEPTIIEPSPEETVEQPQAVAQPQVQTQPFEQAPKPSISASIVKDVNPHESFLKFETGWVLEPGSKRRRSTSAFSTSSVAPRSRKRSGPTPSVSPLMPNSTPLPTIPLPSLPEAPATHKSETIFPTPNGHFELTMSLDGESDLSDLEDEAAVLQGIVAESKVQATEPERPASPARSSKSSPQGYVITNGVKLPISSLPPALPRPRQDLEPVALTNHTQAAQASSGPAVADEGHSAPSASLPPAKSVTSSPRRPAKALRIDVAATEDDSELSDVDMPPVTEESELSVIEADEEDAKDGADTVQIASTSTPAARSVKKPASRPRKSGSSAPARKGSRSPQKPSSSSRPSRARSSAQPKLEPEENDMEAVMRAVQEADALPRRTSRSFLRKQEVLATFAEPEAQESEADEVAHTTVNKATPARGDRRKSKTPGGRATAVSASTPTPSSTSKARPARAKRAPKARRKRKLSPGNANAEPFELSRTISRAALDGAYESKPVSEVRPRFDRLAELVQYERPEQIEDFDLVWARFSSHDPFWPAEVCLDPDDREEREVEDLMEIGPPKSHQSSAATAEEALGKTHVIVHWYPESKGWSWVRIDPRYLLRLGESKELDYILRHKSVSGTKKSYKMTSIAAAYDAAYAGMETPPPSDAEEGLQDLPAVGPAFG